MTMHGVLHPKSDIDRVYNSREMGGRGLISSEGCIRMEQKKLGWYVRNSVEPLIEDVKTSETIEYIDTVNKKEFKQSWLREEKELWENKIMYGRLVREMLKATDEKETWHWLRTADLKFNESHVVCCARTGNSNKLCETQDIISHIVSKCEKLAQTEYKRRHNNFASFSFEIL